MLSERAEKADHRVIKSAMPQLTERTDRHVTASGSDDKIKQAAKGDEEAVGASSCELAENGDQHAIGRRVSTLAEEKGQCVIKTVMPKLTERANQHVTVSGSDCAFSWRRKMGSRLCE